MMIGLKLATNGIRLYTGPFIVMRKQCQAPYGYNAISNRSNEHTRNKGKHRRHDQRFEWVDPAKDNKLVNDVQRDGDEENFACDSP